MKYSILFIVLVLAIKLNCKKINTTVISQAIADIINKFSDLYSMRFKLLITSDNEELQDLSRNIIMKTMNPITVRYCVRNRKYSIMYETPTVILMDGNVWIKFLETYNGPIELLTGIETRRTTTHAESAWIFYDIKGEKINFKHNLSFLFQIFHSTIIKDDLVLFNYVFQTPESCISNWRKVNTFSKKRMFWKRKILLPKYEKFYNCPLGVYSVKDSRGSLEIFENIFKYEEHGKIKVFKGISGEILKIFANRYGAVIEDAFKIKRMDIYLTQLSDIAPEEAAVYQISPPICYIYSTFVITDGYLYGPYEKLILPFDEITWISLICLYSLTFFTIIIIYRFSREVQWYVFGKKVNYPTLGSLQILFGLGYIRPPSKSFARILFMMFTLFCLVIRTGYQGKMYDFMTKDVRHRMPQTIDSLFRSGIKIISDVEGNLDIVRL